MASMNAVTAAGRQALLRLSRGQWYRVTGGFVCTGQPRISLDVAQRLISRGLAQYAAGRLELTAPGRVMVDQITADKAGAA